MGWRQDDVDRRPAEKGLRCGIPEAGRRVQAEEDRLREL